MNESTNNPLNDFLNQAEEEPENNLFAPSPFPSQPEPAGAAVPVPPPVPAPQAPAAEMPGIPAIPPVQTPPQAQTPSRSLHPIKRSRRQRYSRKIPLRKP